MSYGVQVILHDVFWMTYRSHVCFTVFVLAVGLRTAASRSQARFREHGAIVRASGWPSTNFCRTENTSTGSERSRVSEFLKRLHRAHPTDDGSSVDPS